MGADTQDRVPVSLGELVSGLGPGDLCPWCGGVLRTDQSVRRMEAARATDTSDLTEVPILCCAECGGEVYLCGGKARGGRRGPMGAAA